MKILQKLGPKNSFKLINLIKSGVGNIGSISRVILDLEIEYSLVENIEQINENGKIILPGIGSFDSFIKSLKQNHLFDKIYELVILKKIPILGICVGMQSFFKESEEGFEKGFGFFNNKCTKFLSSNKKIPHLGWNKVYNNKNNKLFENIEDNFFYFAHSYHVNLSENKQIIGYTNYDKNFPSAVNLENIYGVQFHPEKSYDQGLQIIKNFITKC